MNIIDLFSLSKLDICNPLYLMNVIMNHFSSDVEQIQLSIKLRLNQEKNIICSCKRKYVEKTGVEMKFTEKRLI